MTRRGGSTREHAREELRYYGDETRRWYERLIQISGGPHKFKTRVLPGVAVFLALVIGLTAWAVAPGSGSQETTAASLTASTTAAPSGLATASPTTAASETPSQVPLDPNARPTAQRVDSAGPFATGVNAHDIQTANTFANFRGRPNDVVVMFTGRYDWGAIASPWIGDTVAHLRDFPGTWVVTVPLFPEPSGAVDTDVYARTYLTNCANGNFDKYFRQFGQWLNSKGRSDSVVRLGWEFNGTWFVWKAVDPGLWAKCFHSEAKALLSVAPEVRIEWTVNAHTTNPDSSDPFLAYPGDDVVDIIGVDTYDQYPPSPDVKSFNEQCNMSSPRPGLCKAISFARAHRKLFAVGEWGLVGKETPAGKKGVAGGDNPLYIEQMYRMFYGNKDILAYEAYFNEEDIKNVASSLTNPTQHPNGAARYQQLWSATQ